MKFLWCCQRRLLRVSSRALLAVVLPITANPTALRAEIYQVEKVMSGLVSPRGLAMGPDGSLYVAEAGNGGNGPAIVLGSGNTATLGASSALSRLRNGVQERVVSGLPSVSASTPAGLEAGGLSDIVFDHAGQAYGLMSLGANPTLRSSLGAEGASLANLIRLPVNGESTAAIADLGAFESANNPDGGLLDTNPFGFAWLPNGNFVVADAGANAFLGVTSGGVVSTLAAIPTRPNPLPIGPPMFQSVPTTVALGPDGNYYFGQLTGFPFPPGSANVYRFNPISAELSELYTGFTQIMDLTFDADGKLYVLQLSTNGTASAQGPGSGVVIKIDLQTGQRTTIVNTGLTLPGSLLVAPGGDLYITNNIRTINGEVLRLRLVPEPSSAVLLLVGAGALYRRIRRQNLLVTR